MTDEKLKAAQELRDDIKKVEKLVSSGPLIYIGTSSDSIDDLYTIGPFGSSKTDCFNEIKNALTFHLNWLKAEYEKM
jgi:hypothetical protein